MEDNSPLHLNKVSIADEITVSYLDYAMSVIIDRALPDVRDGKGLKLMDVREDDWIEPVRIASTHDLSLWFTSSGKVHSMPVYKVTQASRAARGKAVVNMLPLQPGERIQGLLALRTMDPPDKYVVTVTRRGVIKRTELPAYANIRSGGIIAPLLDDGDQLISVHLVGDTDHILIATKDGMAIRFPVGDARPMGRPSHGVRAIDLREGDEVISAGVVSGTMEILSVSALGYGKRTALEEYREQGRGGLGLINLKVSEKTGPVVAAMPVTADDEIIVATKLGMVIRTTCGEISQFGRSTQGVRVIRLNDDDEVVSVTPASQL